jgi:hypothetical protein
MPKIQDIQSVQRYYGELFKELDQLVKEKSVQESFAVDRPSPEKSKKRVKKMGMMSVTPNVMFRSRVRKNVWMHPGFL